MTKSLQVTILKQKEYIADLLLKHMSEAVTGSNKSAEEYASEPNEALDSFAQRIAEEAKKEGAGEERERIAEAVKSLKVEEAPPFSANDSHRRQADLINEHLMPAVRERFLALLTLDNN